MSKYIFLILLLPSLSFGDKFIRGTYTDKYSVCETITASKTCVLKCQSKTGLAVTFLHLGSCKDE